MKKFLLTFLLLASSAFAVNIFAQTSGCSGGASNCGLAVSNSSISIISTDSLSFTQTALVLNIEFDLTYNSGNKDIFIHSWLASDYPSPSQFPCSSGTTSPPTSTILGTAITDIGKSFLDIGLDNSVARGAVGVPVSLPIYTTYTPDPTVVLISPSNSTGMTVTKTFISGTTDHVVIKNARVVINQNKKSGIFVKTDVWSRNGTNSPAQCWVAGIVQSFNDPQINGWKNCSTPRQYVLGITTGVATPTTLTYSVWIDMNDNGIIEPLTDVQAVGPTNYPNFSSSNPYTSGGPVSYPPYSSSKTYADHQLIISATTPNIANAITAVFANPTGCAPLPVHFLSFNAKRNNSSSVGLTWQTASESNNSGFSIERNINGSWMQVAFVPSQALGGNSQAVLSYSFTDQNSTSGMSQYRIKQIDIDGKSSYSEIRAVRGMGQSGKMIVYPNPTSNGTVNVVFQEVSASRDISITDMSGRTVQSWKAVTNNNLQINNLTPGLYALRVVDRGTGEQTVEKIVVDKR